MRRAISFAACLLLFTACAPPQPGDAADGAPSSDADDGTASATGDGGITFDPESAEIFAIMPRIRFDVPTPQSPADGWMLRNYIDVIDVPDGDTYEAEDCREASALDVGFYWIGVPNNTFVATDRLAPVSQPAGPFNVTRYDVCVSTVTDPATKCTGVTGEEIYQVPAPTTYFRPPSGLPRDTFYLRDISWQVRACRSSPAVCGQWSDDITFAWGFGPPRPLREEVFTLADEAMTQAVNLHFCNVDKSGGAATATQHIVCLSKAENNTADPSAECMDQFRNQDEPDYFIRLSSNSPEDIIDTNELPNPNGDNLWTVGACDANLDDRFCAWSNYPPRTFTWPPP